MYEELDADTVERMGLDPTGRDGDPRFPYTREHLVHHYARGYGDAYQDLLGVFASHGDDLESLIMWLRDNARAGEQESVARLARAILPTDSQLIKESGS